MDVWFLLHTLLLNKILTMTTTITKINGRIANGINSIREAITTIEWTVTNLIRSAIEETEHGAYTVEWVLA